MIMLCAACSKIVAGMPIVSSLELIALFFSAMAVGKLTVIANAPNPAGFALLRPKFAK